MNRTAMTLARLALALALPGLASGCVGMALGGWMSGAVFDLTGSYRAAFLNGIAWNVLNLSIVLFLLYRLRLATTRKA